MLLLCKEINKTSAIIFDVLSSLTLKRDETKLELYQNMQEILISLQSGEIKVPLSVNTPLPQRSCTHHGHCLFPKHCNPQPWFHPDSLPHL